MAFTLPESRCTPAGHDNPIMLELAVFGSIVSYIYSAPPLKLKQSGWVGNYALGSSYIALPWWAGQVGLRGFCLSSGVPLYCSYNRVVGWASTRLTIMLAVGG